jgi:putative redox protein
MRPAIVTTAEGKFKQRIAIGDHLLTGDESKEDGGDDAGPEPHEFLLAALGACTSMTVRLYTQRKGWPLTSVRVEVHGEPHPTEGRFVFKRTIRLEGDLDDEQRARCLDIANKCPVHRTLTGKIEIETSLEPR